MSNVNAAQSVEALGEIESYHGYVGRDGAVGVISRAKMAANRNRGEIASEPQSLEAYKGFPHAGPPDGKIASANTSLGKNLDEQTAERWVKNLVKTKEITLPWHLTAQHRTTKWDYFITKNGWDPNSPLTRATFRLLATVEHDGTLPKKDFNHAVVLPEGYSGYHVLLAVWEIADTDMAFYNVIDLEIDIDGTSKPEPGPIVDAEPPTAPDSLHDMGRTSDSVDLMWLESTDNVGVTNYVVERADGDGDFQAIISVPFDPSKKYPPGENTYSYLDKGLPGDATFRYRVFAFDEQGNKSFGSDIHTATTKPGTGHHEMPSEYPEWNRFGTYSVGDRVRHLGHVYEALAKSVGSGDPGWITAPSLWRRL